MLSSMTSFLLAFIPLFVAIDPVGSISLFVGLTHGYSRETKRKLALHAVLTALVIGLSFGVAGHVIFRVIGITSSDFQIAGGILLLIHSVKEMFGTTAKKPVDINTDQWIGVVPLGIPITAGPAFITTLLILHDSHHYLVLLSALLLNLGIAYVLFAYSDVIIQKLGEAFSRVFAKLVAIFLAAIGVMMIRRGIEVLLKG